jgi:hypothetical protein
MVFRRLLAATAAAIALALLGSQAALALDEPNVPEPVASYFATALVPRLADLYGPGKKADSGIDFDSSTKVGDIHRVFSWTADYLARKPTDTPIELTNNWVAPVTVKNEVVGLATVWINPTSDDPELADFDLGPGLVSALAAAPQGMVLIRDDLHSAWFATDGTALVPLVSGSSGIATATTIAAYQKTLTSVPSSSPVSADAANQGLIIAGIVLCLVVVMLAVFVLMPDRRRRADSAAENTEVDERIVGDTVVGESVDDAALGGESVDDDTVDDDTVDDDTVDDDTVDDDAVVDDTVDGDEAVVAEPVDDGEDIVGAEPVDDGEDIVVAEPVDEDAVVAEAVEGLDPEQPED